MPIKSEIQQLSENFPFAPKYMSKLVSLDIETAPAPGFEADDDAGLNVFKSVITRVGVVSYTPEGIKHASFLPDDFEYLKSELREIQVLGWGLVGQNLKFDLKHLIQHGIINLQDAINLYKHDTQISAAVNTKKPSEEFLNRYEQTRTALNKTRKKNGGHRKAGAGSLKVLAPYFLGIEAFWETEDHDNERYCLLDCLYTLYLHAEMMKDLEALNATDCYESLVERNKLLMTAEVEGINFDVTGANKRLKDNEVELVKLEQQINDQWSAHFDAWRVLQLSKIEDTYVCMADVAQRKQKKNIKTLEEIWVSKYLPLYNKAIEKADTTFNLNSPTQLSWLLKERLGYDITDLKDEDEESTGKSVLEHLAAQHDDVGVLIKYRKAKKLDTSFYPKLLEFAKFDGRIHMNFNITGAKTGRLSSNAPNTQQIPKHMRDLFVASEGNVLVDLDMSMLEPILIAYYSEDPTLTQLIIEDKSFHSYNALIMFNLPCGIDEVAKLYPKERAAAKLAGLSVLYGSGAGQLMFSLTGLGFKFSFSECQKIVYKIRDAYPKVKAFKKELDLLLESGATITNYLGRPIKYDNRDDVYMKGFNGLIQGSGSDIVVQSAVDLYNKHSWIKPRILVHDSICIEVPEERSELAKILLDLEMTKWDIKTVAGNLKFKTEGGYGSNWKI